MQIINYNQTLKEKARRLRNSSTPGEIMLWKYLKNKQLSGYTFHRQKPLYYYIVDFYCSQLMLAIEIDGKESHEGNEEYDDRRQKFLESKGIKFLRFQEMEVRVGVEEVIKKIKKFVIER